MLNMAFVYQPHFKTECFRVDSNKQQGSHVNYIVVTCSPKYNGIWKYPAENIKQYKHWQNGKLDCICVPIKDCKKLQPLNTIRTESIKKQVKNQQEKWFKNQIKNRNYDYVNKPEWII